MSLPREAVVNILVGLHQAYLRQWVDEQLEKAKDIPADKKERAKAVAYKEIDNDGLQGDICNAWTDIGVTQDHIEDWCAIWEPSMAKVKRTKVESYYTELR